MLERRAAPFSQNIRKAFEVLVGAARVKKSVKISEAFIAAHEAKLQEEIRAAEHGRPADAPAAEAIAARPKKRLKVSSPTVTAPATATSCRPRAATREILIKWKLSGSMVAVTPAICAATRE